MFPVCLTCSTEYRPERIGVFVEVLDANNAPYQLWAGDRFHCPTCGHQVIASFADAPLESHESGYQTIRQMALTGGILIVLEP